MRPSVLRGNKKKAFQPVIITTNTTFKPKISERTIKKRQAAKEKQLKPPRFASGLDLCGTICLYMFLVLTVIIGGGGIAVCAVYFSASQSTQTWKIAGIVLGSATVIIGIILILLTIFKQARNRPWRYKKKKENLVNTDNYYVDDYDDDDHRQTNIDNNEIQDDNISIPIYTQEDTNNVPHNVPQSAIIHSSPDNQTHEMATSPIPDTLVAPLRSTFIDNDVIFCPGCNRLHPRAHQCMYATRTANSFAPPGPSISHPAAQDSIGIQTEGNDKQKKNTGPHTTIDRTSKYSSTTETQTNVTAKPSSNITESIILRRVPIPTAKVVVQQPTTKVMIVKVPNIPGQLILQPRITSTDEQPK